MSISKPVILFKLNNMKIYKPVFKYVSALFLGLLITTSCEDYLDQSPEAVISEADVFTKFVTFQGYVEDIYQYVVDETLGVEAYMNWNFGDDVIEDGSQSLVSFFDQGNYLAGWTQQKQSLFVGDLSVPNQNIKRHPNSSFTIKPRGHWTSGWAGIRKSNTVLKNLNKLVSATQEERDIIAGQAYFFRAYFHFEIMRAWGGVAYVDSVYAPNDEIRMARLSYRECAMKAAADFRKAAELLPASWDETTVGQATLGQNAGRLTKGAAYSYLGKNLLYAASPLMNGVSTGSYTYDQALCKEAAEAFNEVIKLTNQGYHGFESWADYHKNFYFIGVRQMPLGKEIIFNNPIFMHKRWDYGESTLQTLGAWGLYASPTANYVEYFGMANGLPINAAGSGYDANDPWANRDPRFYYNIVKDRDRLVKNFQNADSTAQFFVGGRHRNNQNSITGFGHKKFTPAIANQFDNGWANNLFYYECPQMRLADVYLMYAEAVNEYAGPGGSVAGGPTAIEAVNIIRSRATVPDVDARFLNQTDFRETIRQERAVELAFEGHRWYDLRRWHVSHLPQYREKYALDFDKEHTYYQKRLYNTIVFEDKHYWLPFAVGQVTLYPQFAQNPGW